MTDIIVPINGGMFDSTEVVETASGFPRGNKAVDSEFFAKMISCFYSDGLWGEDSFAPSADGGMVVRIKGGIGWARGYMAWEKEDTLITLTPGGTYAIALRLDISAGEFSIVAAHKGSNFPQNTDYVVDLTLAELTVPTYATSITDSMIVDTRGDAAKCGYVTSTLDALTVVDVAQNANMLGGFGVEEFLRKSGGTMTGNLRAATDATGISTVRNIGYGTTLPTSLGNGDVFILLE